MVLLRQAVCRFHRARGAGFHLSICAFEMFRRFIQGVGGI